MRSCSILRSTGVSVAVLAVASALCVAAAVRIPVAGAPAVSQALNGAPLSFETNRGQADPSVKYLTRGAGYTMFLKGAEAVVRLKAPGSPEQATVRMSLVASNASPRVLPSTQTGGVVNYFLGNDPKKWLTGVPAHSRVGFGEVYPGIDVEYYGRQGQLEYDFHVRPNGDPADIRIALKGVTSASVEDNGDLRMETSAGTLVQERPIVYQEADGVRRAIGGGYVLARNAVGAPEVSFELGIYDHSRELVIDPALNYCSYLGGIAKEIVYGIALGTDGSTYLTGQTESNDFPTKDPFQSDYLLTADAFVTKIAPDGKSFVYSTYLGGLGRDGGGGIAVGDDGTVYLTGFTECVDFPVKNGFQSRFGGIIDAFVCTLAPSGGGLFYSTYFGGDDIESAASLALDSSGKVTISGGTKSKNLPMVDAYQAGIRGSDDAFIARFDTGRFGLPSLVYSTYLGGSNAELGGREIAIDAQGDLYVTGETSSPDFPATGAPFDPTHSPGWEVFVAKLSADGSTLLYSAFFGGAKLEQVRGLAVDQDGSAYVTGFTESSDYPTTGGAFDKTFSGLYDIFVTKLTPDGVALAYSTLIGEAGSTGGYLAGAIAIDDNGSAYVTGQTGSVDFPQVLPFQSVYGGGPTDAFVLKLTAEGDALVYSSYLGGDGSDSGANIAVDAGGNCYVAGVTNSRSRFPVTAGAPQGAIGGTDDGWFAKLGPVPAGPPKAPSNLTATATSTTEIRLDWVDESANEESFEIQRKLGPTSGAGVFASVGVVGRNVSDFLDSGLATDTTYSYRVRASSDAGDSLFSNTASATTSAQTPDGPSGLVAAALSASSIKLTWQDNSSNELSFRVERSKDDGASFVLVGNSGANTAQFTVTGLQASTRYSFRVRAENAGGNSGFSNVASAMTFPPPPAAPSGLTTVAESYASVRLNWKDNSSDELEFQIHRAGAAGDFARIGSSRAGVVTFTDTGLVADTEYRYKVCAANNSGLSAFTAIVKARTLLTPPAAPTGLRADIASDGVGLTWRDVSTDETGFKIQRAPLAAPASAVLQGDPAFAVIASLAANSTAYKDTTAKPDSRYLYRVLAAKGLSLSLPSNQVEAVTVPAAPGDLKAVEIAQKSLLLKWLDQSPTETGFRIEKKIGGISAPGDFATVTTVSANVTSFRVEGLDADTLYTFRTGALSSSNGVNYSALVEVRTLGEPPAAPSDLKAAAVSSSAIKVEWLDKSGNEKRFEIQRSGDGGATFTPLAEAAANVKSYTDEGLAPESTRTYRVRAVNDSGSSAFSNTVSARTLPAPPGAPGRLAATEPTVNSIKLTWRDEGGKAAEFELQRKSGTGAFAKVASPAADVRQFVDRGLSANTAYTYRIRGKNEGGFSPFSEEAGGLTLPAAPRELTAVAAGPRQINLKWVAASSAGSYAVERHSQDDATFRRVSTVNGAATTFSDSNLPAGAKMTYRVRAFNASGESDPSNEATALTEISVQSLSLTPPVVRGGRKVRARVTLSGPAPAAGLVIVLTSSKQSKAGVPRSVTARAGATSAEFAIETHSVKRETVVTISAEAKGVKKDAPLTLKK